MNDAGAIPDQTASRDVEARATARVLVVEDESLVAFDLAEMLADMGFANVAIAGSYDEAALLLDEAGETHFRLAIFDLNLDGRLSVPLIERASAMGTRVIVASGYDAGGMPVEGSDAPRLMKPYDQRMLARLVDDLIV